MICPDSGKGPLDKRIKEAAEIYLEKEGGMWPKICRVPEELLRGKDYPHVPGIKVVPDPSIRPGVFVLRMT